MQDWAVALIVIGTVLVAFVLALLVSLLIDMNQQYAMRDRWGKKDRLLAPFLNETHASLRPPSDWVQEGIKAAKSKKVVFAAILRNGAPCVGQIRNKVRGLAPFFKDWAFVWIEEGSVDGTRDAIEAWINEQKAGNAQTGENKGQIHLLDGNAADVTDEDDRMVRMARRRNLYLDFLQEQWWPHAGPDDVVAVLDPDLDGAWSLEGVLSSIAFLEKGTADAVSGSCLMTLPGVVGWLSDGVQLDPGAFVERVSPEPGFCKRAIADQKDWDTENPPFTRGLRFTHLVRGAARNKRLLPVCGAFSGMTLYRAEALFENGGARYGHHACEHHGLQHAMHANGFGKAFVNPFMRMHAGGNLHDIPATQKSQTGTVNQRCAVHASG